MRLRRPRGATTSSTDTEVLHQPWYHDFAPLGHPTPQAAGIFGPNQVAKQPVLFGYIDQAIRMSGRRPRGLEMFCADGLYSHYALQHGARHMTGVDLGDPQSAGSPVHLQQAIAMAKLLGHRDRAEFRRQDVFDVTGVFDFVICAGGLYHLTDPGALLRKARSITRSALVVQTIYSLAEPSPDYFETPAPGWTWGCRFSHGYLLKMLADCGWTVVETTTNELTGNDRAEDRGSAYALCITS